MFKYAVIFKIYIYMELTDLENYLSELLPQNIKSSRQLEWERVYNEMNVHLNGAKPYNLIGTRRPKEDTEIFNYRIANFEPITKGILRQAMDSLYRIFNDKNYELRLSPSLNKYINSAEFNGFNFMTWIQRIAVYEMILDPNGIVVILPEGEGIFDSGIPVIPKPYIINSYRIIELTEDILVFLHLPENVNNIDDYYKQYHNYNNAYWIIDKESIYTYTPLESTGDSKYLLTEYYKHNIGSIPYIVLSGEWDSNLQCYSSFFNSFIPFANEAIRQYSDWQGAMVTSAYPIRVYRQINCTDTNCSNGYYLTNPITGESYPNYLQAPKCRTCNGTGKVPASSPYGVLTKPERNNLNDNSSENDNSPLLEYISPPVDILKFSKEAWESMLDRAAESLHITEVKTRAETGLAKKTEREREYALLLKISNNIFDNIIRNTLTFFEYYLNVINPVTPQIIKPTTFDLRTENDLIQDLIYLKQANVPTTIIRELSKELIKRRYAGDLPTYYKQLFLIDYVTGIFDSTEEQLNMYELGVYTKFDLIKIRIAPSFIDRLINSGFVLIPDSFDIANKKLDEEVQNHMDSNITLISNKDQPTQLSI